MFNPLIFYFNPYNSGAKYINLITKETVAKYLYKGISGSRLLDCAGDACLA